MIKAIFFDMDGTLVAYDKNKKGGIPAGAAETIARLRKKGVRIFAATGRCRVEMDTIDFLRTVPFDGIAVMNGQYCYAGDEDLYLSAISPSDLKGFREFAERENIAAVFIEKHSMYTNRYSEQMAEDIKEIDTAMPPVRDIDHLEEREIIQIMPCCDDAALERLVQAAPGCKAVRWSPLFVDVFNKEGGKTVGMDVLLGHFGLTDDETMAFGDGQNDIAMLQKAKYGIAMGNADEKLKAAADYITADANDGGIAKALAHYIELGVFDPDGEEKQ